MAKNTIRDLDTTAANNTDITGVNIDGSTAPGSNIDNAMRGFAKILADVNKGNEAVESTFTIGDSTDITKTFRLVLSGITTSTQRTMTMPDADVTWGGYGPTLVALADVAAFNTLVNAGVDTATTSDAGVGELSTAAEFRNDTAGAKFLTPENVWDAAEAVALSDGASIALDLDSGFNFTVTLGGNRTLANPTNAKPGQSGWIEVTQDGTGSRTLAYGSNYEFANRTAPTLTTTASAVDTLFYTVKTTSRILISIVKDNG